MPNVSTISEILTLPDDAPVYAFKGVPVWKSKHFPPKDPEKGASFQAVEFQMGQQKIRAMFRGCDPFPEELMNKLVYLNANHGSRGWTGLKAKDQEPSKAQKEKGNTADERVLWVTPSAHVTIASAVTEKEKATTTTKATHRAPSSKEAGTADDRSNLGVALQNAAQSAHALIIARKAAAHACRKSEKLDPDFPVTPEFFQAATMSIFIRMDRTGAIATMPIRDIVPMLEERLQGGTAEAAPEPEPEPPAPEPEPEETPPDEGWPEGSEDGEPPAEEEDDIPF